jgi:hypothetical protein
MTDIMAGLILLQLALGLLANWRAQRERAARIRTEEALCEALARVDELQRALASERQRPPTTIHGR